MLSHSRYDIFLSFRFSEANVVRAMAEHLETHGFNVWFAEYQISREHYFIDKAIEAKLESAIRSVRYFILFTNNSWHTSDWCRHEYQTISSLDDWQTRTLHVILEKTQRDNDITTSLESLPSITIENDIANPTTVMEEIKRLGWSANSRPIDAILQTHFTKSKRKYFTLGISLDPAALRYSYAEPWFLLRARDNPGEHFLYSGEIRHTPVHMLLSINPYKTALSETMYHFSDFEDDPRAEYKINELYLRAAASWIKDEACTPMGFHLIFLNQHSNFGITSIGEDVWERRYAIRLMDTKHQSNGEITIAFSIKLETRDIETSFRNFCNIIPHLDHIVQSVQISPAFSFFSREWWTALIARVITVLLFFVFADYAKTQSVLLFVPSFFYWLCGVAVSGLCFTVFHRQALLTMNRFGMLYGHKMNFLPTMGNLLDRIKNALIGSLMQDCQRIFRSALSPLGWLTLGVWFFLKNSFVAAFITGSLICGFGILIEYLNMSKKDKHGGEI